MAQFIDLQFAGTLSAAATRCGSDLHAVLAELDITIGRGSRTPQVLPVDVLVPLLDALARRATRGNYLFALAEAFNFDGRPAISAFLSSAATLREAHRLLDWLPTLVHPAIRVEASDDGRRGCLLLHVDDATGRYRDAPALIELIAAVSTRVARTLSVPAQALEAVEFGHAPRDTPEAYAAFYGREVRFGAAATRLWYRVDQLDAPLPGALPELHARAEERLRLDLFGDELAPPASVMVEELLRSRLDLLGAGIAGVAAALRLHPRTLQRRLQGEGRGYAELLAGVRHRLACELLRSRDLDIETIAGKLGYAERRSFTQAFQEWQGSSPSEYRRRLQQG